MLCRRTNCGSLHPELCSSPACIPHRDPTCTRFHGHFREEGPGDVTNPGRFKPKPKPKPNQGNGRGGALPPSHRNNKSAKPSNRPPTRKLAQVGGSNASGGGGNSCIRQDLNKSLRDLALARKELAAIKRTHAVPHSPATHVPHVPHVLQQHSGHARQLSSFAATLAAVLETALTTSGIRLASA